MKLSITGLFFLLLLSFLFGCEKKETYRGEGKLHFTNLPSSQTNITFNNLITENDSVNLIANEYSYIGSGVGVGDFNNDNLPDIFFAGNQVSSKLYLNKGKLEFEDVTAKSGLTSNFWATGVSIADVNSDGFDDIYVCVSGSENPSFRKNKLYINNGNLTFSEQAEAYGLADNNFSTQAVFFDYDKDGDLDAYLLNHLLFTENRTTITKRDTTGKSPAADKLFRNEGYINGATHPVFKDVSISSGIKEDGYGLGVVVSDFNDDNWPDIYIANDYTANDILWINNKNGTFSNLIATSIKHQSYSSMGVDAADINNDGLTDVVSLDMLPETNEAKKNMYSLLSNERFELEKRIGYEPQYMRNMLQLNNGSRTLNGKSEPFFSEIGQFAGIHETDWSWSVLMADFDNDGWKDIHITNGYGRDMLNIDFILYKAQAMTSQNLAEQERNRDLMQKLSEYGSVELKNYLFKNNTDLTFSNISDEAGLDTKSISHGCAYADFDNDGDLDLAVNNINKEAFLLRNETRKSVEDTTENFLQIRLKGNMLNQNGFGAKLRVYSNGKTQIIEQYPVKGYASTVDKRIHFGIEKGKTIDSVSIVWPSGRRELIKNIKVNSIIVFLEKNAIKTGDIKKKEQERLFVDVTDKKDVYFKHAEIFFYDYQFQRFLLQKYSQLGPFISQGDVNGDKMTDFFIGGGYNQWGNIFIQQKDGSFRKKAISKGEKGEEDLGSILFDADGDKDLDLFINSGSFEYEPGSPYYIPRIYKNDGKGNFTLDTLTLPKSIQTSAQSVAGSDFDSDGDTDLFVAGRVSPGSYPLSPRSYFLENRGGKFHDITEKVCPELIAPGMITSVVWADVDNDKKEDLIIAGEWMPIRFFKNTGSKLKEVTDLTGLNAMRGLWRSLSALDLDKDGDVDFIAGNLGLNNKFKVTKQTPLKFFVKDLDNNGLLDPILAYYIVNKNGQKELYPAIDRTQFAAQVPRIKNKYFYNQDYSTKRIEEIFEPQDLEGMQELVCEETRTCWLENNGKGQFKKHFLPIEAQFAPVNAIVSEDVDGDKNIDLILAGNEYQSEVSIGRYDASYGLFLKGNGKGKFTPVSPLSSGLIIDGDVKDLKFIHTQNNEKLLVVGINDSEMKIFKIK